jgi:hypothetical protein
MAGGGAVRRRGHRLGHGWVGGGGRGRTHRGSRGGGRRRKKLTWGSGEGGVR